MTRPSAKHRAWVFTINNPTDEHLPDAWSGVKYCIWQVEQGSSGTRHLQGYLVCTSQRNLASVKGLSDTAHWEPRRGTHLQARDYASKADTRVAGPFVIGQEPAQGSRTDLREVLNAVKEGLSDLELAETYPSTWVRYHRALSTYRVLLPAKERPTPTIAIIYGPSRSGKSSLVLAAFPGAYWRDKGKFWDGYSGQKVVVFDEFYGWYPYHGLNRLLDRYPLRVEVKGSTDPMEAHTFVFTSNKNPRDWYRGVSDPAYALLHRFRDWATCLYVPSPPGRWQWEDIGVPISPPVKKNPMLFHPYYKD